MRRSSSVRVIYAIETSGPRIDRRTFCQGRPCARERGQPIEWTYSIGGASARARERAMGEEPPEPDVEKLDVIGRLKI